MTEINFKQMAIDNVNRSYSHLNVHDHLKNMEIPKIKEIADQDNLPYHVMTLNLYGDMNISTIIRTAHISGCEKIWVFGRRGFDRRGTVGAMHYNDFEIVNGFEDGTVNYDVEKFSNILNENKLYPIMVEQGGLTLGQFNWHDIIDNIPVGYKPLIVFGNEGDGIPENFVSVAQKVVSIPQRKVIRSYNVSGAAATVLWDMRKDMGWL